MTTSSGLRALRTAACIAALSVAAISAPAANAAVVIDNSSEITGSLTLNFFTVTQSFEALGTGLEYFGVVGRIANPDSGEGAVTFSLYDAADALLGTRTVTDFSGLTPNIFGGNFIAAGFAGIGLTTGDTYKVKIEGATTKYAFGVDVGDGYAGGSALVTGRTQLNSPFDACGVANGSCDLSFTASFTEQAAAVPEPGTWALMIAGFGLAGTALRRRRTVQFA